MQEYFQLGHAETIFAIEQNKPHHETYYMPMHAVRKESSTTTKLSVAFDASSKTTSGAFLNDQFFIGPTVHPTLIDVLIRFRRHKIALTINRHQQDVHVQGSRANRRSTGPTQIHVER